MLTELPREGFFVFDWPAAWARWQVFWWGAKTRKMIQGRKHGFCFCANSPSSNELIGYVDLPDFNEIWPKWSSDINASNCVRLLRNSKYFSCDVLTSDGTTNIFYCPSLGWVFSQTNRNKEKAWHTLLAYYLLIDIVQSVWLCAFTWEWVIQLSTRR